MDEEGRPQGFKFHPILVGLFGVIAGAFMVATYQLVTSACNYYRRQPTPSTTASNTRQNVQNNQQEIRPSVRNISNTTNPRLIPTFRYNKDCNEDMCAVCLSDFKEGEQIRVLPDCLHFFHVACIDRWLNLHSNCPLCRADTSSASEQVAASIYFPAERSNGAPTLELNRLPDFGV